LTWDEYAAAWSRLHGGFDPAGASTLVRGWLRLTYRAGSGLAARGATPMAVTTAGLLLCLVVPAAVLLNPIVAAVVVLLAAFADGLDGAVAVITGRATRLGYVYDSVADRIGEAAWLAAFWLAGAPGWLVASAGAAGWLQEYARARASAAGMTEIAVVTVAERPTRVLIAIFGLLLTAVVPSWSPPALWLALAVVGLAQLTMAIRRELAGDL
jgi:CDP-diacylglycerol--glycerol-3-phosphate 3-phosphatidyltransferase